MSPVNPIDLVSALRGWRSRRKDVSPGPAGISRTRGKRRNKCAICALLVYALIFEGGDLVVSGCQKIGFYNYCLYNKTLGNCECIFDINDPSLAGRTSKHGFVLTNLLTYSSLVFLMMNILVMIFAQCLKEGDLWKFSLGLNCLSLVVLSIGMAIFVSVYWDLFNFSQVTPGFLAVLVALGGMSLLCWIIPHNISFAN
uniref:Uncharacterized protein n=1 Tax=Pyxicephalus adspersus TaxID=30357 RepID=A0AAV3AXG8_PYXAD|nr:TPA: hypothetical protein GDO54_006383 [Pyxicephalus adspersus]